MPNNISKYEPGFAVDDTDHTVEQVLHDIRTYEGMLYSRAVNAIAGVDFPTNYPQLFLGGGSDFTKPQLYVHGPAATPTLSGFNISGRGGLIHIATTSLVAETPAQSPGLGTNVYDRYWVTYFGDMPSDTFATNSDLALARWDLVSLAPSIGSSPTIPRDFEDAVTGAKSSQNVSRFSVIEQPSILITQGTLGGGVPATPSGRVAWCAVRIPPLDAPPTHVDSSGVPGVIDYSMPIQHGVTRTMMPGRLAFADTTWNPDTGYLSTSSGPGSMVVSTSSVSDVLLMLPPQPFIGDAFARCLGARIFHAHDPAVSVLEWVRVKLNGGLSAGILADFVSFDNIAVGTQDGQPRVTVVPPPQFSPPGSGGAWGNGYAAGRTFWQNGSFSTGLAVDSVETIGILLTRDAVADGDFLRHESVEWVFAK